MMLGVCHIADGDNLPDKEAADGLSDLNVRCSNNMRITSERYLSTRTFTLQYSAKLTRSCPLRTYRKLV